MPRLKLAMLGPFRAVLNGDPIETFHYEKVRALLAYLAAESGEAHSRSAVAGLLWPDRPEAVARQNLSQALATLRRVLGDPKSASAFLVVTNQQIRFNSDGGHDIDTAQFLALLAECDEHRHISLAECALCLERVRQAIALYRGDFLADMAVADAPEFYEWVLVRQAWYLRLATRALEMAASAYEERGEYEEALAYAQHQLELTPWQEDSHRRVIRLLALSERRLEALHQFEVCRDTMRAEMDIEPETETLALYERIRSGAQIEPATHGAPHNLQAQLTPLIGRQTELATLTKYLRSADCRLVVLVGPGGSGKSRLAVEVAQHLLADFVDGVYFVSLNAMTSVDSLLPTLAQVVGLNLYDTSSPTTQLQQYLRTKRMLFVLDSFEHLLDGASVISRLLHETQQLRILITSRARLNLQSEQVVRLGGLEVSAANSPFENANPKGTPAIDCPAVQLFLYQARRSVPQFSPSNDELAAIGRICRLVEGMPLSILLAASWAELLEVEEIAQRVSGDAAHVSAVGIDFLEAEWPDVLPRQRSMRTVLGHSWRLLDEAGQVLLARLSVFRREFSAGAARQVTGASLKQLKALVDRSLLETTQAGRYSLHEHLRQYAMEQLAALAPQAAETVGGLHAAYYVQRLRDCGEALHDDRQVRAVSEIASEFENMRAAWQWSVDHADVDKIAGGLDGLFHFLSWKYRLQEGQTLCEIAVNCLQTSRTGQHQCVLAAVLTCNAGFSRLLGDLDEARGLVTEAQRLVIEAENSGIDAQRERALVLQELGYVTLGSAPSEAEAMWRESLTLFRGLGDQWRISQVLNDLADATAIRAGWDEVHQLCEEALQIQRALGDQRGTVRSLKGLCSVADNRGRIEEAITHMEESKKVSRRIGDLFGVIQSDFHIGIELMYLGKFSDAFAMLGAAADAAEDLGAMSLHAWILHFLAWDSVNLGMYAQARDYDSRSLSLFRQLSEVYGVAFVHLCSGQSLLAQGDIESARVMLEQSLLEFRQLGDRDGECITLNTLACTELLEGNLVRARDYVSESLAIAAETSDYGPALGAIAATSLLKASCGEADTAVELCALALNHPYIGQSRWHHEVAGQRVATLTSSLSTESKADAQRRGKARNLMATIRELDNEFNR